MLNFLANVTTTGTYTCGGIGFNFSGMLPYIVSTIILVIKIFVPIILVIYGMLDLGKAVMAQKEDEIKKGQNTLIKRIVAAVIVFFVIAVVQMIIKFVSTDNASVMNCFNCFVNGNVDNNSCMLQGSTSDGI